LKELIISTGTLHTALFMNYTEGKVSINLIECERGQIKEPDFRIQWVRRILCKRKEKKRKEKKRKEKKRKEKKRKEKKRKEKRKKKKEKKRF
jgi:hypothetical protein